MTQDQFQNKYHGIFFAIEKEALSEIEKMEPVYDENGKIVYIRTLYFPDIGGYQLILDCAWKRLTNWEGK